MGGLGARHSRTWTVFAHPVVQLETLPRIRAEGLRVQLTTGSVTIPGGRREETMRHVGAIIVEVDRRGIAHCRHLLSSTGGDGSLQDLTTRVVDGMVITDCDVEALNFGDVHHSHMDPAVAAATWGIGSKRRAKRSLVDSLRPRAQVFHDVCDFEARNGYDTRDHLKRFAQLHAGLGDVEAELSGTASFLAATRRRWSECIVVASNHDLALLRWLRESDFREDPRNALFFLRTSLALHERLLEGQLAEGIFEQTLRGLSRDGLAGVRFLQDGASLKIAGIEVGIHGHKGPDGRTGGMQVLERLGLEATIGHTHRPTTRDGLYSSGVCQTELAYAAGPLTSWAVAHVVTYFNGARQHLFYQDGRFHA